MVDPFDGGISVKNRPRLHQAAKFCRSCFVVNEDGANASGTGAVLVG
jgi:hypothetical protein